MLPAIGAGGGPNHLDLMLGLGRPQAVGLDIAAVEQRISPMGQRLHCDRALKARKSRTTAEDGPWDPWWAVLIGLMVWIGWTGTGIAREGVVPEELVRRAQTAGIIRVMVQLDIPALPEGALDSLQAVRAQHQAIAAAQSGMMAELAGTGYRVTRQFATIPFLGLEAAPDALAVLEQLAHVVGVTEDRLAAPVLAQSVPLVGADQAWAVGLDGTGWAVAVLDTGVDSAHPFLAYKVVEEACFSGNGNCPNGRITQIGSGAGVPCSYAISCPHGTHVAGIAAGGGNTFSGVAKGASVIAIQVFSRVTGSDCVDRGEDPCALAFISDLIAGLEHVFTLQDSLPIAAVNVSLGEGRFTDQASCDAAYAAAKAAIDNLRLAGIATVIASGNTGFLDSLSAPGCISTAVSVGSTTKTDLISSLSNSAAFLSLLAPGESITSSIPGGGFAVGSGTSAATPHVAGAWALLKQYAPKATVSEVLTALQTTGLPRTHPRNGVTTSRIRIFQALSALSGQLWVMEFPVAPSGAGGLTFRLWVTNRTTANVPLVVTMVPSGMPPSQQVVPLGAAQIAALGLATALCPPEQVCRLLVQFPGGAAAAFDAVLELLSTAGAPVGFVTPALVYTTAQ
jgi:subtilisin